MSAFHTRPEKTTRLDVGVVREAARASFSFSLFYSDVQDYILIESNYAKGMRRPTITRNVDASTWGGEADALFALSESLQLSGTLAYTHGRNETDDAPLAQMPPLEARLALEYSRTAWSAGALLRTVAEQDRYVVNQGNIVGQELGPTGGFTVVSVNGGWRPREGALLTAGIDNLLDRTYAEHLSRSGAMVQGYVQTTRVNVPGLTPWVKLDLTY